MSGLFSGMKGAAVKGDFVSDTDGTYWQLIDNAEIATTRKHVPYVKINKTVIRVLNDANGQALRVGDQPQHAIWTGDYFLSEVKKFARAAFGLSNQELDELDGEQTEALFNDRMFNGQVVEVSANTIMLKANPARGLDERPFTKVRYVRNVTEDQVREALSADDIARFFPSWT